jgi:hypothetical protein
LSAEQFAWLKQAVSNQREVWDILMQLQQITAKHALKTSPVLNGANALVRRI